MEFVKPVENCAHDCNVRKLMQLLVVWSRKFPLSTMEADHNEISMLVPTMHLIPSYIVVTYKVGYHVSARNDGHFVYVDTCNHTYDDIKQTIDRICELFSAIPAWVIKNPGKDFPLVI